MSGAAATIVFDGVSKEFPRGDGSAATITAVRDLSFAVGTGELVAVLGKTGCGKSTMFNLLSGIMVPSRGTVRVDGHDPYRDFAWFRGKIGIVFQSDRLMPWRSAIDNAALGLELNKVPAVERHAAAASWLRRLGLAGHEQDFPHALSGGMRQRVSIARAFAIKPEILLCDEPFSALDEVTSRSLRGDFLALVRETKATCIFITHSIEEALQLGQRILVFHRPARIAYATEIRADLNDAERAEIRAEILHALTSETAGEGELKS
jgi:NitT/TauT family transport system ATP-binding protein